MEKKWQRTLFIFRRDLRLDDNTGLLHALENSDEVIPAFIFTPEQIEKNPYRGDHCLQFMIESLEDLSEQLRKKGGKLYFFYGNPDEVAAHVKVDAIIVNRDYTPYSIRRDEKIRAACKKKNIAFLSFDDALLHPIEETFKADGKPYTIFSPYFKKASKLKVPAPRANRFSNYFSGSLPSAEGASFMRKIFPKPEKFIGGGRGEALKILKSIGKFTKYLKERDFPAENGTTHLSAHLKFTTISPREAYHAIRDALGSQSGLIRSLYWRDFFTSIAYCFPHIFKGAFHKKFDHLEWSYDKKAFKRWCEGKTGFPIVDAGMREMNETGYMHNRVRMIAASFLVKDLHIDWRWGEKYFAQTLVDYDPAVNNGNWQWSASTGCDAQPYFRIFNPWAQQAKFDPECVYIKKWIPELKSIAPDVIHKWYLEGDKSKYPHPMVDHAKEAKAALKNYKTSSRGQ